MLLYSLRRAGAEYGEAVSYEIRMLERTAVIDQN